MYKNKVKSKNKYLTISYMHIIAYFMLYWRIVSEYLCKSTKHLVFIFQ